MSGFNMKVVNADSIELELTARMPLSEWRALKAQMSDKWPSWEFGRQIDSMIRQAEKHFTPENKE
jgi:hypothetical protein